MVRTLTWNRDSTPVILGYWHVGDVVGQPLSRLCPYEVKCLTEVEVSALPANLWDQSLEAVFKHLQQVEELHCILRATSVLERLKCFLRWLAKKFGYKVKQGWLIDLRLTYQEISEAIGAKRITVKRLLTSLSKENLIMYNQGQLILLRKSETTSWIY
ncbi:Crp/Fnr family transcriptional regulator [Halomicronema hongdechloris]|uniref:Crp/Fnr family transcriptional regulator n=1 Tax=Halomicronema hongdechloris TaxID=1209493 RepID=UPI001650E7E9|nr:Crp/Fnr family transcriptional regulator [Halomicronema hongdechloris]